MNDEIVMQMNEALMDGRGVAGALAVYESLHPTRTAAELLGLPLWPNTPGDVGARLCLEVEMDTIVEYLMWQGDVEDGVMTFNEGTISLIPAGEGVRVVGAVDEHYIGGSAGHLIALALEAVMEEDE